jgi:hypothetical protein
MEKRKVERMGVTLEFWKGTMTAVKRVALMESSSVDEKEEKMESLRERRWVLGSGGRLVDSTG